MIGPAVFDRYRALMISTRFVSLVAAAWMIILAGYDMSLFINRSFTAENAAWQMVFRELMFMSIVAAGFIGRLIALARMKQLHYGLVAMSWFFVAVASWWYVAESFPMDGHTVYSLFYVDRLASWCLIFVLFSFVRFAITAMSAFLIKPHEVGSYS